MIAAITSDPDRIWGFQLAFSIFALHMLPFASVFLSARLRARLGLKKVVLSLVVLLVVIPVGFVFALPSLLKTSYDRFVEKDQTYYAEIARACDLILEQHPLGTNAFVDIDFRDGSLPKAIRDLEPSMITISTNRVGVIVGVRGFGVSWGAQDDDTNSWALSVYPEGPAKALYVEKKP